MITMRQQVAPCAPSASQTGFLPLQAVSPWLAHTKHAWPATSNGQGKKKTKREKEEGAKNTETTKGIPESMALLMNRDPQHIPQQGKEDIPPRGKEEGHLDITKSL